MKHADGHRVERESVHIHICPAREDPQATGRSASIVGLDHDGVSELERTGQATRSASEGEDVMIDSQVLVSVPVLMDSTEERDERDDECRDTKC